MFEVVTSIVLLPAITGVAGGFTPCALGINTIFVGALAGKPRARRLWHWLLLAAVRAALLTGLGLLFGLIGEAVGEMAALYQQAINIGLIVLGALFIVSRFRPVPLPALSLVNPAAFQKRRSLVAMGLLFGLDISACIAPLVLALLAQTVLLGDWVAGAVALFVFGVALSLPALAVLSVEGADRWLVRISQRYRNAFYFVAGGFLMIFGTAEFLLTVLFT